MTAADLPRKDVINFFIPGVRLATCAARCQAPRRPCRVLIQFALRSSYSKSRSIAKRYNKQLYGLRVLVRWSCGDRQRRSRSISTESDLGTA
jgi:hypothetical protein